MNKYDKAAKRVTDDIEFKKEQEKLRSKYQINTDVIIKEKSNMAKFTIRTLGHIIKTIATVAVMVLAAVGIMSLIYPETRNAFLTIITSIFAETKSMF